jgi:transposase
MIGKQDRDQRTLFIAGDLADFIPEDHILKQVHKVLDLSWLRQAVAGSYCLDNGRPGIDPEAAVRLMLAGFFAGIKEDRKLMREAQVHLAMRWFAGYRLDEPLPHHSSLTRIRQRWGEELFRQIFARTVDACLKAELVNGETVHIDATLIRADVSWESITKKHAEHVWEANATEERQEDQDPPPPTGKTSGQKKAQPKKSSPTDPDATLTTSRHDYSMEPSYKQHTVSDDRAGVIVDVAVTTGEASEGQRLLETLDRVERATGIEVQTVTADAGYAHPTNYEALEQRGIQAVIPPGPTRTKYTNLPGIRFKYSPRHQRIRCPRGKYLHRSSRVDNGWVYRTRAKDCRGCSLRPRCFSATGKVRAVLIVDGYEALVRARRKKQQGWIPEWQGHYQRHRNRVEGAHGEAKTQHGLRRAARRGLWNVAIQVYLTAAVMNLKRLAIAATEGPQPLLGPIRAVLDAIQTLERAIRSFISPWRAWRAIPSWLSGITSVA